MKNKPSTNSVLLKFWGFTGLASLLASVQFPAGDTFVFVHPQISEALFVMLNYMKKIHKILIWSFVILLFIGLTTISAFVIYLETSIDKVMTKERQERLYSEISQTQELPVSYYKTLNKYFPDYFRDGVWSSIFKQIIGKKRNTCQCRQIYFRTGFAKIPFEQEIIALELEDHFSQRKCYEYNMSISEFGSNTRGITEAANFFYEKEIPELSEKEILELNIIPNAPTLYSPIINKQYLERAVDKIKKNN